MDWQHRDHPGRRVRLCYCLNLQPADDLDAVIAGMRAVTLPLRDRLAPEQPFGVGLYLNAAIATRLSSKDGAADLERLVRFSAEHDLVPFTFNAFPFGGFHRAGLKSGVFRPTWRERERLEFTLAVAEVACALARNDPGLAPPAHISISTHTGLFAEWVRDEDDLRLCAENMARAVGMLARLEEHLGTRIVLSLESEPRANCQTADELALFLRRARVWGSEILIKEFGRARRDAIDLLARHLGACVDTCHAAVEFEAAGTVAAKTEASVGKIQFSSALSLVDPAHDARGRELLFGMHEPVYLHQVTGIRGTERVRAQDLAEVEAAFARGDERWTGCDEWRCHFHVPVDLEHLGAPDQSSSSHGLATTRSVADELLRTALADAQAWTLPDLHVEIETYTWDVLPRAARGAGEMVDGLEREYRHVMRLLEDAEWRRVPSRAKRPPVR